MKPDAVGFALLIGFALLLYWGVSGLVDGNGLGAFGVVCAAIALGIAGLVRLLPRTHKK
jgi:hypothetical protein